MIKLKVIRIHPSEWDLDVIIGGSQKDLIRISEDRYGLKDDPVRHNQCASIDSSVESELKGRRGVVIILKNLSDKKIIVHEIVHAMWHLSAYINFEMTYETQEWQALMFEYIYEQIIDKTGYNDYK